MHRNKKALNTKYYTYEMVNMKLFASKKVDVIVINISVFLNFIQSPLQVLALKIEKQL